MFSFNIVEEGSVSGICHKLVSDKEHAEVVTKAMAAGAFVNPLNPEVFPGAAKLEAEVIHFEKMFDIQKTQLYNLNYCLKY